MMMMMTVREREQYIIEVENNQKKNEHTSYSERKKKLK